MVIYGHEATLAAFRAAATSGRMHHGWLLHGPRGVGKATVAKAAAQLLLEADDPASTGAKLIAAGTHPDLIVLEPLVDARTDRVARSIRVDQVRGLRERLAQSTSLGGRRVVIVDAVDDLEGRAGPNAMLKMLEEPPSGTVFLLVSHAPGRLLPTIRSRCRAVALALLDDAALTSFLGVHAPELDAVSRAVVVRLAAGSPGNALAVVAADVTGIDAALRDIASTGDPKLWLRAQLADALSLKAAAPRYEAFLQRAPAFIAAQARNRTGDRLGLAITAWEAARALADVAVAQSLPVENVVFEIAGRVAALADADLGAKA